MANGLLDYISGFGATPPEYLGGLLGQEAVDKLKGRAATTGIANAVLGYLAAPKNQNLGLGRIIGQSLQAGMQGAQGVYDTATQDYMAQQKIADLQRKQAQQTRLQDMLAGITDPNERLAAELAPEQYVAAKFKPQKLFNILTPEQATAYGLPTDKNQRYQMTETGVSLIGGTETKESPATTLEKLQTYRETLVKANPNDPRIKSVDAAINKETNFAPAIQVNYGQPVAGVDANGNPVFFQPSKTGGAPAIISGVTPQAPKPAEAITKQVTGIDNLQSAINNYREKLKTWKPQDALDPNKRSTMTTTYNNMMLQAKEAYGLGVLNGPDYSILTDTIADPTSAKGIIYGATGALDKQAETLNDLMSNMKNSIKKSQNIMPKNEKMPQLTSEDKKALDWAKQNPNDPRANAIKQKLGVK